MLLRIKDLSKIYRKREWPQDFLLSLMIAIEKKIGARKFEDFRTTSLFSHPSKVLLSAA